MEGDYITPRGPARRETRRPPLSQVSRHLAASNASFRRETLTEVELVSGGLV
jgi:hypothetical protein